MTPEEMQMEYARVGAKIVVQRAFAAFPGLDKEIAYERRVAQAAHARAAKGDHRDKRRRKR